MARIKTFLGKTEEEFAKLTNEEALPFLPSRARRAMKRVGQFGNSNFKKLIANVRKIKAADPKKIIRTHVRDAVIMPEWIGLTFAVHSGKEFKNVQITMEKIGRRLGDFVHTTGRVQHSGPGVGATRGSKFIPLK
ncbi:hypothetical protein AUJ17_01980 [Candidatus Micrarchaeota archaeon CG1_02_47_40]|nr:MAG: hypothetical protein AUJ17_01980 [Candidatus Micrarchaeota archaeon CG1_02_47_40]